MTESHPRVESTEDGSNQSSDCCAVTHKLSSGDLQTDVTTFAALGNDTRYEALRLIAASDGRLCVCEIEPSLGVSQSAVSQALSRLYAAGLVTRRKEGRWRYYAATDRARRLLDALDEDRSHADE